VDYQLGLPFEPVDASARCLAFYRGAFWRCWNSGNYASEARHVTKLCTELGDWVNTMANKKQVRDPEVAFYFVNVAVDDDDLEGIAEAYGKPDGVFDALTGLLSEGLRVAFSVNARNDMTTCSLTDKREGSASQGATLSGSADGWYDALRVTLYKYHVLLGGDLTAGERVKGSKPRIM